MRSVTRIPLAGVVPGMVSFGRRPTRQRSAAYVRVEVGEVVRVPDAVRAIRVLSGRLWVAFSGEDMLLAPGDHMTFEAGHYPAVITPLDGTPAQFEMR